MDEDLKSRAANDVGVFPVMGVVARARDINAFMWSPTPYPHRHAWSTALFIAVLIVFTFDFAVDSAIIFSLSSLDGTWDEFPELVDFHMPLGWEIVTSIIIAPIVEEALFRGWLSGKRAALRFACFGFLACAGLILLEYVPLEWQALLWLLVLGLSLFGFLQWQSLRWYDTQVPLWFAPNYRWFVWGSSFLFGVYHFGNWTDFDTPVDALILLPYMVGGMFLAYTRTRLGLRAAMLHHALYNAFALLIAYEIVPWF